MAVTVETIATGEHALGSYETVLVDRDGTTVILTLNRPEKYNAVSRQMRQDVIAALNALRGDKTVRAVVLWGGTKVFVAGADVTEMQAQTPLDVVSALTGTPDIWNAVARFPIPVIAAIAGPCFGGGLELAMCCDIRLCADNAQLGQTELNIGLIPGRGGTQRLARLIGMTRAREMILLGRIIKAEEAYRIGLVNAVVPADDLLATALSYARAIAEKSPQSVAMARLMMDWGQDANLDTALMMELLGFAGMFSTEDMHEGVAAFLAKRRADYKGR